MNVQGSAPSREGKQQHRESAGNWFFEIGAEALQLGKSGSGQRLPKGSSRWPVFFWPLDQRKLRKGAYPFVLVLCVLTAHKPKNGPCRFAVTEVRSYNVIKIRSSRTSNPAESVQRQILLPVLLLASSSVLLLSGCSSAFTLGGPSAGESKVVELSGKVHGGNFPVTGATINVYEIGAYPGTGPTNTGHTTAGYNAALTTALATTTTDSGGNWGFSVALGNSFTCANSADELYLVATNGNPGLAPGTSNPALIQTSVAGPCSAPFSSTIDIDEVTTVATEFALAGFSTSYLNLGTSATNTTGLINAFATVPNLVNLSTSSVTQGSYGSVAEGNAWAVAPAYINPPSNTTADVYEGIVPYDTINTLADVLATCVNTASGSSSACSSLFAITGGSQAWPVGDNGVTGPSPVTNTADAALYIAHNPGLPASTNFETNNVANLYALINSDAPFTPYLAAAPASDYALALNFTGGGLGGILTPSLSASTHIAIDQAGNIWVPNKNHGGLFELSNTGAPISPTTTVNTVTGSLMQLGGFQGGGLVKPEVAAIDQNGNVWVGDGTNCLTEYNPGAEVPGSFNASAPFTAVCAGHGAAIGTSIDGNNQIWVAGTNYVSAATSSGALATGSFPITTGFSDLVGWIGADYANNTWYIDGGNGSFGDFNSTGALQGNSTANKFTAPGIYSAFGTDTGAGGCGSACLSFFVLEPGTNALQPINTNSYSSIPGSYLEITMQSPEGFAVDGNGRWYIASEGNSTVPANVTVLTTNGTPTSPDFDGYQGGTAFTALQEPTGIAIDQSGNVWVLNTSNAEFGYGLYDGDGENSANVTEFVGLGAPVNPVLSLDAKNQTYGTKP